MNLQDLARALRTREVPPPEQGRAPVQIDPELLRLHEQYRNSVPVPPPPQPQFQPTPKKFSPYT